MNNNKELDKIVHHISYNRRERLAVFGRLDLRQKGEVILRLSRHIRRDLVLSLDKKELVGILECLDPDEATDIIQLLPEKERVKAVSELKEDLKNDISWLLKFDSETAAGLMNIDYIQVDESETIADVASRIKVHEKRTGRPPAILVMEQGKLIGYLPGHELVLGRLLEKAGKYAKKIRTVKYTAKTGEVLDVFKNNPHNKIVVLGESGKVLGVIYSDDVLKVLREKESSSLYDFAGVHDEESVYDGVRRKVKFRWKWLIINLGTAFLAAFTVSLFDQTISKYVLLAVYMPIVAGMGGNAGTQTLAVLVRGIALKQIELKTAWRTLKGELGSGLVNGVINGLIITAVVYIKDRDLTIGLILAAAMVINLFVSALFGTVVPLFMKKLGKDPASSATIFITTATDVFGFLVFLGLAALILK